MPATAGRKKRPRRKPLPVVDAEMVGESSIRPVIGYLPPGPSQQQETGTTLDVLSKTKQGLAILESKDVLLRAARLKCLRHTLPNDWVANRNPATGEVFLYLCGQGGERVAPFLEINGTIHYQRVPPLPENPSELAVAISAIGEAAFAYHADGEFECVFFGRSESCVGGRAFDPEDPQEFFRKQRGLKLELNIKKAAKTNLIGAAVRKLGGFENLPVQELAEAWAGTGKDVTRIPKGHGWPREEKPGQERPSGPAPSCPECGARMNFRPAGVSRAGREYDAFWGCSDRNCRGSRPVVWSQQSGVDASQSKPQVHQPASVAPSTPAVQEQDQGPQWRCDKPKAQVIQKLIKELREKHGVQFEDIEKETRVSAPELLSNADAAKFIAYLAQKINAHGAKTEVRND